MLEVLHSIFLTPITFGKFALPFSGFRFLVAFVLPISGLIVLRRIIRRPVEKIRASEKLSEKARESLPRTVRLMFRGFAAIIVVMAFAWLFGAEIWVYLGALVAFLNRPFFTSGATRVSLVTVLLIVPVASVAVWASGYIKKTLDSLLVDKLAVDPARTFSIANLVRYFTLVFVIVVGLSMIGIDLSSLTVLFGVLGLGIGFGLQSVVSNFFSGVIIVLTRPIKEGDRILVGEYEGTVVSIRMLTCIINTIANETLIIPNSHLVNESVHNYSFDDPSISVRTPVHVSYNSDLDQVGDVLRDVSSRCPYRVPETTCRVIYRSFDDSGIQVILITSILDARDKYFAISWINLEIWRAFKAAGIQIPFPQRDVHIKTAPAE